MLLISSLRGAATRSCDSNTARVSTGTLRTLVREACTHSQNNSVAATLFCTDCQAPRMACLPVWLRSAAPASVHLPA